MPVALRKGVKKPGGLRYSPPTPHSTLDSFHLCCCLQAAMSPLGRRDGDLPSEVLGRHHSLPPLFPKPTKAGKAGLKRSVLLKVLVIESNSRPQGHG